MRRLPIAFAALLVGAAIAPEALAASIDQNGDYLYTFVRDDGVRTHTHTRQVNERQMEKLSARTARQVARIQQHGGHWGSCSPRGSYANQATLDQSGTANTAAVSQMGNNDSAAIAQSGAYDSAYALQLGNGQQSTTTQTGNHDLALTVQTCRDPQSAILASFLQLGL